MDIEAEAPVLWTPDVKNQLTGKNPDAAKDWRQKEKGAAEDEMVIQHHQLNDHKYKQTLEDGEGQEPGMLLSRGSKRVGLDLVTEQQKINQVNVFFLKIKMIKSIWNYMNWKIG